ncbi:hydantoinase/oxoprolinase family protein [Amycolatopsis panacis]|uniref:Hydantoinase/oxoprolinase family protein n=2 Tax=Amycolatopsis panacis TaxID=2340917 RepID=A0A419I2K9_9PSEU|nr:hydantoinase/oxoprolinase family protein [Amycolatopsis panacis]
MSYQISADTGGTFIDVVISAPDGHKTMGKALTTHDRVSRGLFEAVDAAAATLGRSGGDILAETSLFIYGTTRATNAIVTRNVAKTAYLTTEGFPDVLVLKEGGKSDGHDFTKPYPQPYIPKSRTFEVPGRVTAEGDVVTPLDEDRVRSILETLRDQHFEAVAVCLLWSVVNSEHELIVGRLIEEILPGVPYTLSHQLLPIIREYRRASATAIDASLKPLMQHHFRQLEQDVRAAGYAGQMLVSTSIGGVMTIDEVIAAPIHTAKSGPAMAPLAGVTYSTLEGLGGTMIVCDTGGTTFDVGLSRGGQLVHSRDTWLGGTWEGDLLGISSVDIRSIGSGGGSIAWVDGGGLLRVGPQSAGSEPGPACYGRGGTEATVSDAACVLGYFNPDYFLGGRMGLDAQAAHRALKVIADRLGLGVHETAWGILSLASDAMVKAVHEITVAQGINPRESTLVAGGGAAGINILRIAQELGSENVLLPNLASALSATGMHFADIVKEESAALLVTSDAFDTDRVNATLERLETRVLDFRGRAGLGGDPYDIEVFAEARYPGQGWDIDVRLPMRRFAGPGDVRDLVERFHSLHESLFAIRADSSPVVVTNWKVRISVRLEHGDALTVPPAPSRPVVVHRDCYFGAGLVSTPIYRPHHLEVGQLVSGPAIIEEPNTTLVVYPGTSARVSTARNYILHVDEVSA